MLNACELCTKISVEKVIREETERVEKMRVAKIFAEEIIAPILEELTDIPDHYFIGYRLPEYYVGLYRKMSDWEERYTLRGNPKKERTLADKIEGSIDFSKLDYEVLNQYLSEFGFQISYELSKWVMTDRYSTSTTDRGLHLDCLYLSMTCPIGEF